MDDPFECLPQRASRTGFHPAHPENTTIDTSAFTSAISGLGTMDLASYGGEEVRLNLASVRAMNSQKTLKVIADKDDTLVTDRQWKYVQSRLENDKIVHGFGRSDAKLDLQKHIQWQDLINQFDVNGDDSVDPLDVLAIINQINTGSGGSRLPAFDPAIPYQFLFLDVDGDNGFLPLDVLAVINLIAAADQDEDSGLCLLAKTPDSPQPLTFKTKNQCFRT